MGFGNVAATRTVCHAFPAALMSKFCLYIMLQFILIVAVLLVYSVHNCTPPPPPRFSWASEFKDPVYFLQCLLQFWSYFGGVQWAGRKFGIQFLKTSIHYIAPHNVDMPILVSGSPRASPSSCFLLGCHQYVNGQLLLWCLVAAKDESAHLQHCLGNSLECLHHMLKK